MSKLFKLKHWVTLDEAARYLTAKLPPDSVEVADLLQYALDKHLVLSLSLVNPVRAKLGSIVKTADAPRLIAEFENHKIRFPGTDGEMQEIAKPVPVSSFVLDEDETMVMVERVLAVRGVWDLAGWGGEDVALRNMHHELTGAPLVKQTAGPSTWLRSPSRPSEHCELYELAPGSSEPAGDASYVRATGLPKDSMLGVRVSEIERFLSMLAAEGAAPAKPLDARKETAYLNIIGALVELIQTPRPGRDSDAAVIREMVENYGDRYGISPTNLQKKIPEARRSLEAG